MRTLSHAVQNLADVRANPGPVQARLASRRGSCAGLKWITWCRSPELGDHAVGNLQVICRACNLAKGAGLTIDPDAEIRHAALDIS